MSTNNKTGAEEKTRSQYMAGEVSHDEYYGQFVTPALIQYVARTIGADAIRASQDKHFNDIPLVRWDQLHGVKDCIKSDLFKAANNTTYAEAYRDKFMWSLGDQVCIAKAAARAMRSAA